VARAIAAEIRVRLSPAEHQRLASPARVDPAAHEAYLKGRFQWNKRTADSLFEAIRFLEQALAIEPRYAAAHAALGSCYVLLPASLIGAQAPAEAMPRAKSAALEAIRLDEGNAEAHAVLGYVQTGYEWDWEGAQRSFRRAIDLNPSYATGRFWYAAHLAARGRTAEAVEEAREAQRLDPISPIITAGVAWMHHLARRYDLAEQQARRTLELAPDFPIGLGRLGSALEAAGRPEQAVEPFERAVAASGGSPEMLAALARAQALCGRRPEALAGLAALDALAQRRYVSDYSLATVHAALGDAGRALDRLEESYRRREWPLAFLAVEPAVDSLRSQARFQDLVRRLGLEPPPPGARE
jgi:tetratricopeptide (TPR) repeat protein